MTPGNFPLRRKTPTFLPITSRFVASITFLSISSSFGASHQKTGYLRLYKIIPA
jgi:hypothetical protein